MRGRAVRPQACGYCHNGFFPAIITATMCIIKKRSTRFVCFFSNLRLMQPYYLAIFIDIHVGTGRIGW